jgi:hypothetical protein
MNAHANFASREELAAYRLAVEEDRAGASITTMPTVRGAPATIPPPPGPSNQ